MKADLYTWMEAAKRLSVAGEGEATLAAYATVANAAYEILRQMPTDMAEFGQFSLSRPVDFDLRDELMVRGALAEVRKEMEE